MRPESAMAIDSKPCEACIAPEGRPCGPKMQSVPGAVSRGSLALHRRAARAARRYKAGQPWRSVVASPGIGGPPVRPEDARHSNRGVPRWPRLASEARPRGPKMQGMPTAAFRGGFAEHRSAACAARMPGTGVSEGVACVRGTIRQASEDRESETCCTVQSLLLDLQMHVWTSKRSIQQRHIYVFMLKLIPCLC